MKRFLPAIVCAVLAAYPAFATTKCASCARDSHGKIARSQSAKREFRKHHPCPATGSSRGLCRGYVIDHIKPLKRGGSDTPGNMQWQTKAAAKAKDRVE
jgi:hypothetical protein